MINADLGSGTGMMENRDLIELLAEKAIAHLSWDDDHPNVGMGMLIDTAVRLAEQDVLEEAARWNSMAALALDFDLVRDQVIEVVQIRRRY